LHEFPSEDVEMERWKKIAARLGNRTPIQVQSRTQKYFIKLHKAGLPIPGRLGKSARMSSKKGSQSSSSSGMSSFNKGAVSQFINNKQMYSTSLIGQRHSTFFPHLKPEVTMTEDEEREASGGVDFWALDSDLHHEHGSGGSVGKPRSANIDYDDGYELVEEDVSDEESVPEPLRATDDYKELIWMKRLRREKEWEQRENTTGREITHLGYRCDHCGRDPIVGPRFTCLDCLRKNGDYSVDLCSECAPLNPPKVGMDIGHQPDHALRPARKRKSDNPGGTVDNEYLVKSRKGAIANYLDPNYQYFK